MANPITGYKAAPKLVEIAPHQAITIEGHRGTEVRGLKGDVWITQTGDSGDYIVPAGSRFCSGHEGPIVVSALRTPSLVSVSWHAPRYAGEFARNGVWLDYVGVERLQRAARKARSEEVARLAREGAHLLVRAWRWITRRRGIAGRLAAR